MGIHRTFDGSPEEREACAVIIKLMNGLVDEAHAHDWDSSQEFAWDDEYDGPAFFLDAVREIAVALWPRGSTALRVLRRSAGRGRAAGVRHGGAGSVAASPRARAGRDDQALDHQEGM